MTVETILRRKGTDVATIEPDASIRRAADWLRIKNVGALVVTSGKTVLGLPVPSQGPILGLRSFEDSAHFLKCSVLA
jgi:CBS domain-containing protein